MKYPDDLEITVPNLLKFILQHTLTSVVSTPEPGSKAGLEKGSAPGQCQVSHLEDEIQRLRKEIGALRHAQDQLAVQIAAARKDERKLKIQKQTLEENNLALQLHKNQLQALYEHQTKQLGELAEKLEELADASEKLLTENALLKLLIASMEETLRNNKPQTIEH